jgi:NADP-dependent 3-hydroxy acid dehydrogenase YdfG
MTPQLDDKIVLVTGIGAGDSGRVGRGVAVACAFEAADVWAVGAMQDALTPLQNLPGIAIRVSDAADPNRLAALRDDIGAINVLINVAADYAPNSMDPTVDKDALDVAWATTVQAPVHAIEAFLPCLLKRGGAIINIAPPAPDNPDIAHETAAAALSGFGASLAARHDGVRCNTVRPGRLGVGSVESIAQTCLYLASESGAFITGQTLTLGPSST